MRAILVAAASALCLVACSQQAIPPPAHIVGTNSLALVNDLLFVTSPGASELRVLDLRVSPRDFVRAPNPLEPLSIPVLNSPTVLARDIAYDANGDIDDTTYNPYVYAQGAAAGEISIVGTRRDTQLVELKRLVIGETVTAIAARGPSGGSPSTLYFATLGSGQGRLWQVAIPSSDPATGRLTAEPGAPLPVRYGVGSAYQGDPISSIAVLPQNKVAVASRAAGSRTGRTIILDPNGQGQRWVLDFPSPVRQLVTHPTIYASNFDGPPLTRLAAGARIFGVLDDDACPPPPQPPLPAPPNPDCPGILAVEGLQTGPGGVPNPRFGMRSLDATGYPMLPIRVGFGLISGLSVAPTTGRYKAGVPLVGGSGAVKTFDFLGIASTSNGQIFFFDASALTPINISTLPAQVTILQYVDSAAGVHTYAPGPIPGTPRTDIANPPPYPGIKVASGAAADPSELVSVVFQGVIPDFSNLSVTLIGGETQLPYGAGDARRLIGGKDRIVVSAANGCSAEVPLSAVDLNRGLLQTTTPVPCMGAATFSVRAGGDLPSDQPYVVSGNVTGYMGRTNNNQDFAFPANVAERYGRYYYHPPPDPDHPEIVFDPTVPQIQFTMGPGAPDIQRDWQYAMVVESKFAPESVTVDVNYGIEFHSPGASAYVGALSDLTDISRLYVAYPSANAVLEFPPQLLVPNAANFRNIAAFR
jgi:hypothetical protein